MSEVTDIVLPILERIEADLSGVKHQVRHMRQSMEAQLACLDRMIDKCERAARDQMTFL